VIIDSEDRTDAVSQARNLAAKDRTGTSDPVRSLPMNDIIRLF